MLVVDALKVGIQSRRSENQTRIVLQLAMDGSSKDYFYHLSANNASQRLPLGGKAQLAKVIVFSPSCDPDDREASGEVLPSGAGESKSMPEDLFVSPVLLMKT